MSAVGFPGDAAIRMDSHDDPPGGSAKGFDTVTKTEIGCFGQGGQSSVHGFPVENARYVMGGEGGGFAPAADGKLGQENVNRAAGDFSEGVAVEEKERGAAMAFAKKPERFPEGYFPGPELFPALLDVRVSFSIMAVLSASSFARSSIEAVDKLPVPVFDKSGSGL